MASGIVGILLAGGNGSRFGSDKLLHPLAPGVPLAVATATRLLAVCEHTVAVVRPGSDRLASLLADAGCQVVVCADAGQGMGHSLAAGVGAAPEAGGWLVALADMPFIAVATYRGVADALRAGASLARPVADGRQGHPVGFAPRWFAALVALRGDQGARAILAASPDQVRLLPVNDDGIWRDVDRPGDLGAAAAAP